MRRSVPLKPEFVQEVTAKIIANEGDSLPVSALPIDGTFPVHHPMGKKKYCSPNSGVDPEVCIQCGKCTLVCPHAVIRGKIYDTKKLANPPTFKRTAARWKEFPNYAFTIQISPEDCTGCGLA